MTSRTASVAIRATIILIASVAVTARSTELRQTIGTVNAVDAGARRVEVITGCGHALRVMVFKAAPECRIQVGGVAAPVADLRRGQIVVVQYRDAAPPYTAESIATRAAPDPGRPK